MRVLVTNDDGVGAPGLAAVACSLVDAGHEVIVVAPAQDCSGQGAALGPLHITGKIEFDRVSVDGLDVASIAVKGPPALCVMAACLGGFGRRPDVVVSGINAGANTGRAVLHSGTVGAALTGLNFGCAGIAVSQAVGDPHQWASAAQVATLLLADLVELPHPIVLNVNVPNRAPEDIAGVTEATLDAGGVVQAALVERELGVLEFHIPQARPAAPGSDSALVEAGYVTVTPIAGPHQVRVPLSGVCERVGGLLSSSAANQLSA